MSDDPAPARSMSSRTSTTGPSRAIARSTSVVASNRRKRAPSSSLGATSGRAGQASSSSGTMPASSALARAGNNAAAAGLTAWTYDRSASRHGQYAGAPPPSQARPRNTWQPGSARPRTNSSTSRDLPEPDSPVTSTSEPCPRSDAAKASVRLASSRRRPTKTMAPGGAGESATAQSMGYAAGLDRHQRELSELPVVRAATSVGDHCALERVVRDHLAQAPRPGPAQVAGNRRTIPPGTSSMVSAKPRWSGYAPSMSR